MYNAYKLYFNKKILWKVIDRKLFRKKIWKTDFPNYFYAMFITFQVTKSCLSYFKEGQ